MTRKLIDLTGLRFGKLIVVERAENKIYGKDSRPTWLCLCDCGKRVVRLGIELRAGRTKNCGCSRATRPSSRVGKPLFDLTGLRFGKLVVLYQAELKKNNRPAWVCQCDCGKQVIIRGAALRGEISKSCGCNQRVARTKIKNVKTRACDIPEYKIWGAMKSRCGNPKVSSYRHYGGRGIKVCERWLNSFKDFYADMGPRPTPKHSIDRIDVNGNYEPSNCRWATLEEQRRNQRPRQKKA